MHNLSILVIQKDTRVHCLHFLTRSLVVIFNILMFSILVVKEVLIQKMYKHTSNLFVVINISLQNKKTFFGIFPYFVLYL